MPQSGYFHIMAEWYAHIGQQQYGPVDEPTLQSWVGQGRLGPYDLIWSPSMTTWSQAAVVFPNWFGQSPPPLTSVMPTPGIPSAPGMPSGPPAGMKPHRGTMILVFGIVGLFEIGSLCCLPLVIFAILAWVMGNNDLREMRAGQMDPAGMSTTSAGRICGIIGVILAIIMLILGVFVFGMMGTGGFVPQLDDW